MQRLARGLRKAGTDQRGFTLTELLVVIVIIGILVGIAVPTFLAQRERAQNAAAQSDLRNAGTAATTCSVDNDGSYDGCGTLDGTSLSFPEDGSGDNYGFRQTDNVEFSALQNSSSSAWSVRASHSDSNTVYQFDISTGQVTEVGR